MKRVLPLLLAGAFLTAAIVAVLGAFLGSVEESSAIASSIAVVSLGLGLYTFYYQQLRQSHQVQFSLISLSYNGEYVDAYCAFENHGNKVEIVIGSTFVFPKEGTNQFSSIVRRSIDDFLPELLDPFSLQPGELALKHYRWRVSYKELLTHFRISAESDHKQQVELQVHFAHPEDRSRASKRIYVGALRFLPKSASAHISNWALKPVSLFEKPISKL